MNPARHLERLVEEVLSQKIFAVDFAWGFTLLERHLAAAAAWLATQPESLTRERTRNALERLDEAMGHLRTFVEENRLPELDRGLAAARQAAWDLEEAFALARREGLHELPDRVSIEPAVQRDWQREFAATVTRHQGESRVTFTCRRCGWEFSYVEEAPVGELEVPFEELQCPLCSDPE